MNGLVRKLTVKRTNQTKDFQHKYSRYFINTTKGNTIVIGDLDVKKMARKSRIIKGKAKRTLNNSTQNTGTLSRFVQFLTYKAELAGKRVIKIDESYTSKQCAKCEEIHDMKLSDRIMKCNCGNNIDRDKNSAINIMKRYLIQQGSWTAHSNLIMSAL